MRRSPSVVAHRWYRIQFCHQCAPSAFDAGQRTARLIPAVTRDARGVARDEVTA